MSAPVEYVVLAIVMGTVSIVTAFGIADETATLWRTVGWVRWLGAFMALLCGVGGLFAIGLALAVTL